MRYLLIILFSVFSVSAWSQGPPITTTKATITRQLVLPQDTLVILTADSGSLAFKGDTLYKAKPRIGFTTCRWVPVGYVGVSDKLSNITGLISQGSNVTISGAGTTASPYVINSSGGGGGSGVTLINTNSGSGLTGGPITTTGTIAADTTILSTKNFVSNTRPWPNEALYGQIYNKQYWDNLGDFTQNGSPSSVNLSISSGFINYTVSSIDWANYTRILASRPTMLQNWKIEVTFKMNTAPSAGSVGFGMGTRSTINQSQDVLCYINCTNSGSSGALNIERGNGTGTYATGTSSAVNLNDIIQLSVTFVDSVITFTAKNLTTGAAAGSVSYTNTPTSLAAPLSVISNWAIIGHASSTTTYQIQSVKISSSAVKNATLYGIGDSKTQGAYPSSFADRYVSKLNTVYPSSVVYASGSATIQDILNAREEIASLNGVQYLVSIGSNSIRAGVSLSDVLRQYRELITMLKGGGASVKHIVIPEDSTGGSSGQGVGLKAFKDSIAAQYSADYIDIWTGMTTANVLKSIYNSGDGVHPNSAGNTFIYNTIVSSGQIKTNPTNRRSIYRQTDNTINISGDSIYTYPTQKKLNYVNHWKVDGSSQIGILQDLGTTAGVSNVPLVPINGMQFNVTGAMGINGGAGGLVFADRSVNPTVGIYSNYVQGNLFRLFSNTNDWDLFNVDNQGRIVIGSPITLFPATSYLQVPQNTSGASGFVGLKLGSSSLGVPVLTTVAEPYALEQDANHLYYTNSFGARYVIDRQATNLTYTQNALNNVVASSTGTSATILTATASLAGLLDTARAKFIDSAKNRLIVDSTPFPLTATYIAYGNASNQLTGKSAFAFDGTNNLFTNAGKSKLLDTLFVGKAVIDSGNLRIVGDIISYQSGSITTSTGFSYITGGINAIGRNASSGRYEEIPNSVITSSASTLTLGYGGDYFFNGTTATYTLPAISAQFVGRKFSIIVKNIGSSAVTINSASGSTIYDTAPVATYNLAAGASVTFISNGTYLTVN